MCVCLMYTDHGCHQIALEHTRQQSEMREAIRGTEKGRGICVYIYIYMYVCMYVCIYIYIYKQ